MKVKWKVIVAREEKHFYTSFSVDSVEGGVWHHSHLFLTLPVNSVGADEVRLQPVVQPVVYFDLDEVQLKPTSDNNWEEEANTWIDVVRRRDVFFKVDLQQSTISPEDLILEVTQVTHAFPLALPSGARASSPAGTLARTAIRDKAKLY